jgi:hypothetical protein
MALTSYLEESKHEATEYMRIDQQRPDIAIDIGDMSSLLDDIEPRPKVDMGRKSTKKQAAMKKRAKARDSSSLRSCKKDEPLASSSPSPRTATPSVTRERTRTISQTLAKDESPKNNRNCYNCKESGHYAAACTNPQTAARPPQHEQIIQPAEVKVQEIDVEAVMADLYSKATTSWLTKDPNSDVDKKVVILSLVQIARKNKLHEAKPPIDVHNVVMDIFERSFRDGIATRLSVAESMSYAVNPLTKTAKAERFVDAFSRYVRLQDIAPIRGTVLMRLRITESIEPLSRHAGTIAVALFMALIVRLLFVPTFEELFKRAGHLMFSAEGPSSQEWDLWDLIPALILAVLETVHSNNSRHSHNICELVIRFPAHYFLSQIAFVSGLFLHVFWNICVISSHCYIGTSTTWLLDSFRAVALPKSTVYMSVCVQDHVMKQVPLDPRFKVKYGEVSCRESFGSATLGHKRPNSYSVWCLHA